MEELACLALACWLGAITGVGLVGTVWDKRQARRAGQRIPEWTFHIASLLGGWAGILVGMVLARHKIRKTRFLAWLLAATFLNVLVLLAFLRCSPDLS